MEREKLITKRIVLLPAHVIKALNDAKFQHECDERALKQLEGKIESLDFQIQTLQGTYRDVVKKAENYSALSTKNEVKRLYESRVEKLISENTKLADIIARMGKSVACPDCGAVHSIKHMLMAD